MEVTMLRLTPVTLLSGTILATTSMAPQSAASSQDTAQLQQVASFEHQVTGVSVSKDGRIFVNFPRWTEDAPVSVAEVTRDGQIKAYPDDEWYSDLGDADRAHRIGHGGALRDQHIHLAQLGHALFGFVSLPRHGIRPSSALTSHTSGRTTSMGEDQSGFVDRQNC